MTKLPKLIKEILTIGITSAFLGVFAQTILPNGIGLITTTTSLGSDSSAVVLPTIAIDSQNSGNGASNILLRQAYSAFTNQSALFVDARSEEDFLLGHIEGAINLPAHAFMDSLEFLDKLSLDTHIITYCDGADCNASIDLAADLSLMGFSKTTFFFGGWHEWYSAGYPTSLDQ